MELDSESIESYYEKWNEALTKGDFNVALRAAIDGYIYASRSNDELNMMAFLGFVRHATNELTASLSKHERPERDDNTCSFCLKNVEGNQLVRGVNVAICFECVEQSHEVTKT